MFGPGLDHWGAEAIGLANVQRSLGMGEYLRSCATRFVWRSEMQRETSGEVLSLVQDVEGGSSAKIE